jgi:hypothetical protein
MLVCALSHSSVLVVAMTAPTFLFLISLTLMFLLLFVFALTCCTFSTLATTRIAAVALQTAKIRLSARRSLRQLGKHLTTTSAM